MTRSAPRDPEFRTEGGESREQGSQGLVRPAGSRMNLKVTTERLEGTAYVITLEGEADLYTAPELKGELQRGMEDGAENVVVDLSATTFIDSTTLGVLIGAVKRLRSVGGSVSLVCSDRNIRKIFEITLLDRVFPIFEDR